jgi:hypothetical protein
MRLRISKKWAPYRGLYCFAIAGAPLIIVDERIPPLYKFGISDIEIVPVEAVCRIFEVKRSLNKKSIAAAVAHLEKTFKELEGYDNGIKSKGRSHNSLAGLGLSVATAAQSMA